MRQDSFAPSPDRHVAVIGGGISGLSAAWLLSRTTRVTLYEQDTRPGGHAHTVEVAMPGGPVAVDTGFIVYNERNYPNLVGLFAHLGVATKASEMSFAASLDGGRLEYSGASVGALLGQRRNAARPRFWRMVRDIPRFYREAPGLLARPELAEVSLGEYLDRSDYSAAFVEDHLMPMGAAIWSTTARRMRDYPLHAFIRFFASHGLLSLSNRPTWRTVEGGSREYVQRILADFRGELRLGTGVAQVRRDAGGVEITDRRGDVARYTDVVLASHADQALALLADADAGEREILGAFGYTANRAVLHSDPGLMPKRRRVWASWNYIGDRARAEAPLCVTYWMNRLQGLSTPAPLFVTLNPGREIAPELIHGSYEYTHPLFNTAALAAQPRLSAAQGRRNTWFCGAYLGSGFHEDGLRAGLAVAEALGGGKRPWQVAESGMRVAAE